MANGIVLAMCCLTSQKCYEILFSTFCMNSESSVALFNDGKHLVTKYILISTTIVIKTILNATFVLLCVRSGVMKKPSKSFLKTVRRKTVKINLMKIWCPDMSSCKSDFRGIYNVDFWGEALIESFSCTGFCHLVVYKMNCCRLINNHLLCRRAN